MYTVLNSDFQVKGSLTLNNGRGSTAFFADTITQQIATDDSNNPDTLLSNSFNDYDKQGNTKQWNHTLTLSVEATTLGTSITTSDYIMYFDEVAKKYYMMKVIDTATDRNSGFITVDCINTAIYELGKQLVVEEKTFQNANLSQVVESVYKDVPFSVVIQDDLTISIDYTISTNTSLQAVVQDLQTKYNVDVDSWITLDNDGQIGERVLYFGHLGSDNGELIRYGGGKGFENINAQELSDIIYTKVYITGVTSDTDTTKGHIGSVNNGLEYIVDDDANQRMYTVGASQQQPVYLEGQLTNNILSEPMALLDWGKEQLSLFNHPRFNYTVTPLHDEVVGIGDSITVQDFHIQPMILVTSKVIQKSTSFASPETNTFVLGEFSSIFSDRTSKNNMVIEVIKKDVTVVQEAADYAKAQADEAHRQAVLAQEQAIHAQTSADGKTTTYTVDSFQDLPENAIEGDLGWVKTSDGTVMYIYTKKDDGTFAWVENINPHTKEDIANAVDASVKTAEQYTDDAIKTNSAEINKTINEVSQEKIDATLADANFNAKAQAMADKALADAKANTATVAQETLNTANQNLATAKGELTDGLQKEVSDRTSAVSALDTKAQGYANAAKTDALNALTEEVTNRQNAVSALDTKATNAVNQAKSDINDTINALSVGGRNYLLNSNGSTLDKWTPVNGWSIISDADRGNVFTFTPTTSWTGGSTNSLSQTRTNFPTDKTVTVSFWAKASVDGAKFHSEPTGGNAADNSSFNITLTTTWKRYSYTFVLKTSRVYFMPVDSGTTYYLDDLQLEIGNMISDYSQAPEDIVYDYTDKDNQIKQTFTQYQQSNDGKVSKAQTDATQALGQVATKVSQTDYDTKTGDLTTKYTQVKQTVDSQATDIVDIKATATSQASKINSISSDVDGTKQSISDINTEQGNQSSKINQISSDVDGTKQAITDIQTADGKQDVRMGNIETSVSGVKSDFSTYKTTNDGAVNTAQTTAQTAVDGLKTKVSQTDYNTKTGQLQTDLTATTQTANQAKTDIVSIKETDGKQDARMTQIESDASGVKTTVSDLQTTQGKQSGDISTLQQRADGFDATVTSINNKVNGLGQVNQLFNTEFSPDFAGWYSGYSATSGKFTTTTPLSSDSSWSLSSEKFNGSNVLLRTYGSGNSSINSGLIPVGASTPVSVSMSAKSSSDYTGTVTLAFYLRYYDANTNYITQKAWNSNKVTSWSTFTFNDTTPANTAYIVFNILTNGNAGNSSYSQPMLVFASTVGKYVQGNYNNNSAISKAQLTADNAALNLSKYQTDADGRISKAQADIVTNANAITQKVSQTDYDKKTGDLTTAVAKAQTTADGAVTTVGNYQTSNDVRVKAAETKISQNANDITLRATTTDLNNAKADYNAQIAQVKVDAGKVETTVSNLTGTVNDLSQVNLINNSDFSPDLGGWTENNNGANGNYTTGDYDYAGGVYVLESTTTGMARTNSAPIPINSLSNVSFSFNFYIFNLPSGGSIYNQLTYLDANYNEINGSGYPGGINLASGNATGKWINRTVNNLSFTPPTNAKYLVFSFDVRGNGTKAGFNRPILVKGATVGKYVRGQYNNNDKIASQQVTIDGITDTVSKQGTNIDSVTKRVTTAEGTLTTATNNITGLQTKQTATANQVTQEITDRKTGDNNTLQSSKDFTSSQISNSENNMKSLINQKADSTTVGVIQNDVSSLKDNVNWQLWTYDDINYLKENGNYLITNGAGTNSPFKPWFYIKVDAPRTDRITQTVWKDLDNSLMYRRTYDGSSWTPWTQIVMSSTLLNIFHDSWSLGTSTNDGITKQMITGIMGQPDGTLILKGNSLILDGDTTVNGGFYALGGNFKNLNASNMTFGTLNGNQVNITNVNVSNLVGDTITGFNFNINKSMFIAPGGTITSGVMSMTNDGFSIVSQAGGFTVTANNIAASRQSPQGYKVTGYGTYHINSQLGLSGGDGTIQVFNPGDTSGTPYKTGAFHSEYGLNNLLIKTNNYSNGDLDEYLNISSASFDLYNMDKNSNITRSIGLRGGVGLFSDSITVPTIYNDTNLWLKSNNNSVVLQGGGVSSLQARENGYLYYLTLKKGSGGSSLQVAGDGAFFIQTSATKYKEDIQYDGGTSVGDRFLTLDPATWQDKGEYEQRKIYRENGTSPDRTINMDDKRYYGLIAEDLVKAGLEEFVVRDEVTGEVNGLEYDKVAISLIPVVREQRNTLNELRVEIERLKDKING
ncbi:hypothetical protein [Leuconostoc pseudomesenteroides]|uniref:hypothetical protein n=1 Tax=Leuconostoc pseudomesenteroides TaxID=33968 RepID=UPI00301DCE0B